MRTLLLLGAGGVVGDGPRFLEEEEEEEDAVGYWAMKRSIAFWYALLYLSTIILEVTPSFYINC